MKNYSFRLCSNKNMHKYNSCTLCQRNALIICFVINFVMFALELFYGLINNSATLLGDSAHNVGDAFVLGASIFIVAASDVVKAKLALLKCFIMGAFALLTFYHVYNNFITESVPDHVAIIAIGSFAFVGNIVSTFFLFMYKEQDVNLKSAYICVRNDTYGNILTIIGGVVIMIKKSYLPDVIVGAIIGSFVLYSLFAIVKESCAIIKSS